MRRVWGWYGFAIFALAFVCGCALIMSGPQKEQWNKVTERMDAIETRVVAIGKSVASGEMTLAEGLAEKDALKKEFSLLSDERKELEAKGVKWYHIPIALAGWFWGKSWFRGLILNRVVRGVENAAEPKVKEAIAKESGKGLLGGLLSRLLASWVAKLT